MKSKDSQSAQLIDNDEDDETIRWVEENIVNTSFTDGLLGDSEEELMNTKFEISKMQ